MPQYYFTEDSLSSLELPVADPQAETLNELIKTEAPAIYQLLSPFGKSLYYPKYGLLLQAEEATGRRYNGTVGIALDNTGKPMHYGKIAQSLNLDSSDCVPYASSYGLLPLRKLWQEQLLEKNPFLQQQHKSQAISLPVVTSGITHGLWIAFQMFLSRGEELLLPDLFWPNYRLIAQVNCGARLKHYNTFLGNGLDLDAIGNELQSPGNKKVFLFNFPHNPTGYSPTHNEVKKMQELFLKTAEQGKHIVIICDDAYWGLYYEQDTEKQSLFAFVYGLHPNILAVKLDGATKEDFAWGLRIGFITFGYQGAKTSQILEEKAGAAVRLSTSNSSRLSQKLLLATYSDPQTKIERSRLQNVLKTRYLKVRQCLATSQAQKEWSRYLKPLPFNSGYFMTFEMQQSPFQNPFGADELRKYLLNKYQIGLIALHDKYLRLAFSGLAEQDIPYVLETLHQAYQELVASYGK